MTTITLLPAAGRGTARWLNGGGVTHEIAVSPAGATTADFLWRVSIATVDRAGDFSRFAGIDRTLLVLDGSLRLTIAGKTRTLNDHGDPIRFPGDAPAHGDPGITPVTDLNIMTRRGKVHATAHRIAEAAILASDTALIVATKPTELHIASQRLSLDRHDALRIENARSATVLVAGGNGILIALFPN